MARRQDVTRALAEWIVGCEPAHIPAAVQDQGVRSFVNWMGCAVGGARHETVDRALDGLTQFSGPAKATVLGRTERLDVLHAALLNGISSHVLDYDDTHLKTIIHPAGPVASAALAVCELKNLSGAEFLHALILGIEVECRIGNSVYPDHYDRGWHITGTTGVFGAAAAVGKLLGLNVQQMVWALSIAATQSSNLREMFGTMTKSFHPGRAAQNGAAAAFLAQANFDSAEAGIEGRRGFAAILSDKQDYGEILDTLGKSWEAELNSYKPFACGIVIHPAIDAGIQIHDEHKIKPEDVETIELLAHPFVLELTGKTEPKTGLESKFSIFHSAAYALARGDGSPTAFTDEAATDPAIVALRKRVKVTTDKSVHEDEVTYTVKTKDGRTIKKYIEHAIGSVHKPLSNEQLNVKFTRQSALVIGEARTKALLDLSWKIKDVPRAADLAAASLPGK
jgi:2-methylcitrate dehydratase PrpD